MSFYFMSYCSSCIFVFSFVQMLFHPSSVATMAAGLASKGDHRAPTTRPLHLHFLFSLLSQIMLQPFKWRENTLKINNVPTLWVHLIASFASPKRKLARLSPYYSPEKWLNAELRSAVHSNNGNTRGKQRKATSGQLVAENAAGNKGRAQTKPRIHPDRERRYKAWVQKNMVRNASSRAEHGVSGGGYMRQWLDFANSLKNKRCLRSQCTYFSFMFSNLAGGPSHPGGWTNLWHFISSSGWQQRQQESSQFGLIELFNEILLGKLKVNTVLHISRAFKDFDVVVWA